MAVKLTEQEKRKINIEHMKFLTPSKLPKGVDRFIDRTCLKNHHHMLYDKPKRYAFCSCCGKEIDPGLNLHHVAKHGEMIKCPICKQKAIFRCIGKHTTREIRNYFQLEIIQKTKEGIIFRRFELIRQLIWGSDKEIKKVWMWNELQRIINDGVKPKRYTSNYNYYKEEYYWSTSQRTIFNMSGYGCYWKRTPSFEYRAGLGRTLQNTPWQYAKKDMPLEYYAAWIKPCEFLEKFGFNNLANNLINYSYAGVSYKADNINKFMRLPKHLINIVKKHDYNQAELMTLQKLHKLGYQNISNSMVEIFHNYQRELNQCIDLSSLVDLDKLSAYFEKKSLSRISILEFRDYLQFCQQLGYDLTDANIVFPKDLKSAHDREMVRIANLKNEKTSKAIMDRYALDHKRYFFKTKDYLIDAPRNMDEILLEGSALHHCVGSYAKKVAGGETTILFVRQSQEPEKPFVTMEVNENRIIQIRAKNNEVPSDAVKAFVALWQKEKLEKKPRVRAKAHEEHQETLQYAI